MDDGRHFRVAGNTSDQTIKTFSIPVTMPDGTTPSAVVLMTNSRSCTYSNFKSFEAAAAVTYKPRGSNTWPGAVVLINAQAEIAGGGERTGDNNTTQYGKNFGPGEQCIIPVDTDGKVHFRLHVPQVSSSYKGGLPTIDAWIVGVIGGGQTPPANDYSNLDTRIKALESKPAPAPADAAKPQFRRWGPNNSHGQASGQFAFHKSQYPGNIWRAAIPGLKSSSLVIVDAPGASISRSHQLPYFNTDTWTNGMKGATQIHWRMGYRTEYQHASTWFATGYIYMYAGGTGVRDNPGLSGAGFTIWV